MRTNIVFVILIAGVALVGGYTFYRVRRLLRFYLKVKGRKWDIISGALALALALASVNLWSLTAVIVLHILAFSLVFDLIALLGRSLWRHIYNRKRVRSIQGASSDTATGKEPEQSVLPAADGGSGRDVPTASYRFCEKLFACGILPLLASAVLLGYGAYNMRRIVPAEYVLETDKAVGDYRIVLITDTHYETIQPTKLLKEKAGEISGLKPDIVILGGDIVEEGTSKEAMEEVFKVLGSIESTYGVFYVYGNHDLQPYTSGKKYTQRELEATLESCGITLLRDSYVEIGDDLILAGRDDASWNRSSGRASVERILSGADRQRYIIMVDHQPVGAEENEAQGVDLLLSGHTHAGQVWPAGTILDLAGNYNYGLYRYGNLKTIVSSGFTGWGYAIRTQQHCEYVQILLKSGQAG